MIAPKAMATAMNPIPTTALLEPDDFWLPVALAVGEECVVPVAPPTAAVVDVVPAPAAAVVVAATPVAIPVSAAMVKLLKYPALQ
jgi:hypothetical protein